MRKKFTEAVVNECREKFKLDWQVTMAYQCEQTVGFEGKDVLDAGGYLPEAFVFEYLHARTWCALETADYSALLSKDFDYSGHVKKLQEEEGIRFYRKSDGTFPVYQLLLTNIESLSDEYYNRYDLIFSTCAFEHFNNFPNALLKMYSALKPGGHLFSMFSPIWSAHNGHHLREITDKQGKKFSLNPSPSVLGLPPWGHLLMPPPQLYRYLLDLADAETAGIIVHHVYNNPSINRLFTEDYAAFAETSPFTIKSIQTIYNTKVPPQVQEKLETMYPGRKLFCNSGLLMFLEKPVNTSKG